MQGMEPYDTEAAIGRCGGHCCWSFEDTAPEDLTAAHGFDGKCDNFQCKLIKCCKHVMGLCAFGGEEKLKSSISLRRGLNRE